MLDISEYLICIRYYFCYLQVSFTRKVLMCHKNKWFLKSINKYCESKLVSIFHLVIRTWLWVQEHTHCQLFQIYIRWFGVLWSRFYCDLVFKFLRGSLSFTGIPSVGEQDTVHPAAKLEYLVILVGL